MSASTVVPPQPNSIKHCTSCKGKVLPEAYRFKTCDSCREKSRIKQRQKTEQKRKHLALLTLNGTYSLADLEGFDPTGKRKLDYSDNSLSMERKLKKLKSAHKGSSSASILGVASSPPTVPAQLPSEPSDDFKEYQSFSTIQPLLRALPSRFDGRYSIVASPMVDHVARAKIVAAEVQPLLPRMSFDSSKNVYAGEGNSPRKFTLLLKCQCAVKKCPGRFTITVRDDKSHPVLLGQSISLTVKNTH